MHNLNVCRCFLLLLIFCMSWWRLPMHFCFRFRIRVICCCGTCANALEIMLVFVGCLKCAERENVYFSTNIHAEEQVKPFHLVHIWSFFFFNLFPFLFQLNSPHLRYSYLFSKCIQRFVCAKS